MILLDGGRLAFGQTWLELLLDVGPIDVLFDPHNDVVVDRRLDVHDHLAVIGRSLDRRFLFVEPRLAARRRLDSAVVAAHLRRYRGVLAALSHLVELESAVVFRIRLVPDLVRHERIDFVRHDFSFG